MQASVFTIASFPCQPASPLKVALLMGEVIPGLAQLFKDVCVKIETMCGLGHLN